MKKNLKKWALLLMTAIALPATTMAQDKVEFSASMPLVSQYIWRGQDLGGVSLQAEFGLSYKGFSLMAFASSGFEKNDPEEFDLTLGYETGNFSISLTDFWCLPDDEEFDYFKYGALSTSHVFEAQVGYDFGLVALNWFTNIAGADGVNKDGKRAYSSYVSATVPFSLWNLDWEAEVGATPWATDYYACADGFTVCDLSLGASKDLKIKSFSLPLFAKVTYNPAVEKGYFTFGITF